MKMYPGPSDSSSSPEIGRPLEEKEKASVARGRPELIPLK